MEEINAVFFQLRVEPLFETRGTAREFGEFMNETKIWGENVGCPEFCALLYFQVRNEIEDMLKTVETGREDKETVKKVKETGREAKEEL